MTAPGNDHSGLRQLLGGAGVLNGAVLRGAVAIVGLVAVLLGPRQPWFVADVVGVAVVIVGLADLVWPSKRQVTVARIRGLVTVVLGGVLVLWPVATTIVLGVVVGALLVGVGVQGLVRAVLLARSGQSASLEAVRGASVAVVGVVVWLVPTSGVIAVVAAVAVVWVLAAVIALGYSVPRVRRSQLMEVDPSETLQILGLWLAERELNDDDRDRLESKLFFEGAARRARLGRFTVLMGLSVLIATFGILADSTAVVIGAMLVAPLMTPIMATAAALVSGWPRRAALAGATVLGGAAFAIVLSGSVSRLIPTYADLINNSQITSRVSPTLLDLLIALAAGAAGAFALSREDVADSLPGVAVAVALVPPLAVVGVSLQAGSFGDAAGALLLFATNLVAIILAGGLVFVLAGFTPVGRLQLQSRRISTYAITVLTGMVLIAVPLGLTGSQIATQTLEAEEARTVITQWLVDRPDSSVVSLTLSDDVVAVVIIGEGEPPDGASLVDAMNEVLGRAMTVDLRWVPEIRRVLE